MRRISVITTVFNAASTLRHCLESVRDQSYPKVEHIIIDGSSTDGTLDIIEEYRTDLARVVSEQDEGIYDGMNKGLRLASGDIVGFLNADDVYAGPDILSKVAKVFSDNNIDSCYGDLVYVDANNTEHINRYWRSGYYHYRRFYWGWMPPHPTFFVRKEVYEKYGLFNLDLGTAADYELMLRFLVRHKITSTYLPGIIIRMRGGGASNTSLINRLEANQMDRKAWDVNNVRPYPWTTWFKPLRKVGQWMIK